MTVVPAIATHAMARLGRPFTDETAVLISILGSPPVGDGVDRFALAPALSLGAGDLSALLAFLEDLGLVRPSSNGLVLTTLGGQYARSGRHCAPTFSEGSRDDMCRW